MDHSARELTLLRVFVLFEGGFDSLHRISDFMMLLGKIKTELLPFTQDYVTARSLSLRVTILF